MTTHTKYYKRCRKSYKTKPNLTKKSKSKKSKSKKRQSKKRKSKKRQSKKRQKYRLKDRVIVLENKDKVINYFLSKYPKLTEKVIKAMIKCKNNDINLIEINLKNFGFKSNMSSVQKDQSTV